MQDAVNLILEMPDAEEAARRLVEEAYARGSSDNITCLVVRFGIWWNRANLFPTLIEPENLFFRRFSIF